MFPYVGELSHFYNTHVRVLTFLVKMKWLIEFCRCGCACVSVGVQFSGFTSYPLVWPCHCFSKTLIVVGVCSCAGGHREVSQLHSLMVHRPFLNKLTKNSQEHLRTHESDVRNALTKPPHHISTYEPLHNFHPCTLRRKTKSRNQMETSRVCFL